MDIEHYERPVTIEALLAAWATRDDLYSRQPKPIDEAAVEAIRLGRLREANYLPKADRARAFGTAKTWFPPEHGQ